MHIVRVGFWRSLFWFGVVRATAHVLPRGRSQDSEARLLRELKRGNSAAFDDLLRLTRPAVERYLRRRLPADGLDDVMQETTLAAWSNFGHFESDRSFKLWLLGIAQNKLRDYWRRQAASREDLHDWAIAEGSAYLQNDFHDVELRESLRHAWEELPHPLREVLELYYGQGLNLPEIALLLDTNLNTIKYRFYRAQAEMSAHLEMRLVAGVAPESDPQLNIPGALAQRDRMSRKGGRNR
jgi:RNA polymerase sigma-70 factor (ECF subfamily)